MNGLSKQAIILCCVVALAIVFVGCGGQTDATSETPSADIASKATTRPMPTAVPRDSATVTVAEPTVALRPAATAPPVPTPAAPSPGTTSLSTAVPAMTDGAHFGSGRHCGATAAWGNDGSHGRSGPRGGDWSENGLGV